MKQQIQTNKIEWREVKLNELAEMKGRIGWRGLNKSDYRDSGPILIAVYNITKDHKLDLSNATHISREGYEASPEIMLRGGEVLLTKSGSIGRACVVPKINEEMTVNAAVNVIRCGNGLLNKYLVYFFLSEVGKKIFSKLATGVAQKNMFQRDLKVMPLLLPFRNGQPDLEEQQRIVAILEQAERLKEQSKQALSLLDEYLKSVFYEMFHNKGFEEKTIGDLCEVISGSTPSTAREEYWNGHIDWITPAELRDDDNYYYYESQRKITEMGLQSISGRLFPKETVMLTTRAPIGKVAIAGRPLCTNQGFKNMVCKKELIPVYLYFWLLFHKEHLNSLGVGATFKEISKRIVENILIPLPPLALQQKFASIVEQVETMKERVKKAQANTEELFNSFMQKAFRGELR